MVFFLTGGSGFFVVAPNLLGHAWRRGNDYSVSALAEDLRPYFIMDISYDVIIGHSMGGAVTLSLLPFLPKHKEITLILVDPAIEISEERLRVNELLFMEEVTRIKTPDEHMAENPAWSPNDCVLRTLGLSMCDRTVMKALYEVCFQLWILHVAIHKFYLLTTSITSHGLSAVCSRTSRPT